LPDLTYTSSPALLAVTMQSLPSIFTWTITVGVTFVLFITHNRLLAIVYFLATIFDLAYRLSSGQLY